VGEDKTNLVIDVNTGNEQVVLGALVGDPETFEREVLRIDPELFTHPTHRATMEALRELRKRGASYAADSVIQITGEVVKYKYLRDLEDNFGALSAENFRIHLELLRAGATKYAAAEPFSRLYDTLDDVHASVEDAEAVAMEVLRKLREGSSADSRSRRGTGLLNEWYGELLELANRRTENFVPTHFSGLDDQLYEGLRPGRVVVVAGRPGMGKSTFCSNLTSRLVNHGKRVLSVPVEAGTESVVEQIACMRARVKAEKVIKTPDELTGEELSGLRKKARELLADERVVFDDQMSNLDELEATVEQEDFDVVILDLFEYLLQGELDAAYVTAELRRLKKLAKRRKFCAVVVQQIRRIKRVKNPRPHLHELKNSGGYEEVADLVLLLHRSAYYNPEEDDEDVLEVKIAKQRRGPQNVTVGFEFQPEICRIGKHTDDYFGGKGGK